MHNTPFSDGDCPLSKFYLKYVSLVYFINISTDLSIYCGVASIISLIMQYRLFEINHLITLSSKVRF